MNILPLKPPSRNPFAIHPQWPITIRLFKRIHAIWVTLETVIRQKHDLLVAVLPSEFWSHSGPGSIPNLVLNYTNI